MLKRKAVRTGLAGGWRLIRRAAAREKVGDLRFQGKEMCPLGLVSVKHHLLLPASPFQYCHRQYP
jgi:hypothetical protein